MLKTWGIYLGALISAFIFFIFYKMWVAWFILVVLLSLPVLSFLLCLFATYSTSFFSKAPVSIHIGTEELELLSIGDTQVELFDPQFPLFHRTLTREEFDAKVKENPFNDRYLQTVEATEHDPEECIFTTF